MPHPFPCTESPELAHGDVWLAQKELGTPFGSKVSARPSSLGVSVQPPLKFYNIT